LRDALDDGGVEARHQERVRRVANLEAGRPEQVLSANVGCITHLQAGTGTRVRHWIEWLDEAIA